MAKRPKWQAWLVATVTVSAVIMIGAGEGWVPCAGLGLLLALFFVL